jgi:hypothetical protein
MSAEPLVVGCGRLSIRHFALDDGSDLPFGELSPGSLTGPMAHHRTSNWPTLRGGSVRGINGFSVVDCPECGSQCRDRHGLSSLHGYHQGLAKSLSQRPGSRWVRHHQCAIESRRPKSQPCPSADRSNPAVEGTHRRLRNTDKLQSPLAGRFGNDISGSLTLKHDHLGRGPANHVGWWQGLQVVDGRSYRNFNVILV